MKQNNQAHGYRKQIDVLEAIAGGGRDEWGSKVQVSVRKLVMGI